MIPHKSLVYVYEYEQYYIVFLSADRRSNIQTRVRYKKVKKKSQLGQPSC